MGGGGAILEMIRSLKSNKGMLTKRTNLFSKDNDDQISGSSKKLVFKKLSDSQLKNYKREIRDKAKRDKAIQLLAIICLGVIIFFLIDALIFHFFI